MSENPTRESITAEMSEILRYSHDSLGKVTTEKELHTALKNLELFYFKKSSDRYPYQYKDENQAEYMENSIIISTALDKVAPVLSNIKETMFRLEKNQQTVMNPIIPEIQSLPNQPQPTDKKKSILDVFSRNKPPPPNPNNPYQSTIDTQRELLKLISDWKLFNEWQVSGTEFEIDEDMDEFGMRDYLSDHRFILRKEISPVLVRVYSEGLQLLLGQEKFFALQLGLGQMKEMFQTRNDFQPQ